MRNASILMNPAAGPQSLERKEEIIEKSILFLANSGIHANSFGLDTKTSEDFRGLARDLSYSYSPLIISGGDGTLLQVLNSDINPNVVLGYLPTGTGNALQRALGIKNIRNALEKIVMGKTTYHDLISYNDTLRCFYAGTGYDAKFVEEERTMKENGWKGLPLQAQSFIMTLWKYRRSPLEVYLDGRQIFAGNNVVTFVGKNPYLGRGLRLHRDLVKPSDGELLVSSYSSRARAIATIIGQGKTANTFKGKAVRIKSEQAQPYECNGELMGPTQEAEIRVIPNAIRLII